MAEVLQTLCQRSAASKDITYVCSLFPGIAGENVDWSPILIRHLTQLRTLSNWQERLDGASPNLGGAHACPFSKLSKTFTGIPYLEHDLLRSAWLQPVVLAY
eukprot:4738626-Amphidinium_carterae.1